MNSILVWESTDSVKIKIKASLANYFSVVWINTLPAELPYGLLLIDADFLGSSAVELCKEIKYSRPLNDFPVIFLTDGDPSKIAAGFAAGASEIINYNSSPVEIAARVEACWMRHCRNQQTKMVFCDGRIELDPIRHIISYRTSKLGLLKSVNVTRHEFHLFFELVSADTKIISRKKLLNIVWGEKINVLARTVDKHISSLREKTRGIGKIGSIRGSGYFFTMGRERTHKGEAQNEQSNIIG